ncbi:hypothetical protein F5Y05DRAFT_323643 [Hypoxylon sp. FL0543]|nr:hypothetical protein F5Y05DRAFT_323643 [Hypoxylon sp. FL0543]
MSSDRPATIAVEPLPMMKRLSPFVYFYEPKKAVTPHSTHPRPPKLVLIAAWMDARDLHLAKYVARYLEIYPTSRILLVKFVFKESIFASFARRVVAPAFAYLRALIESRVLSVSPTEPEILVHTFSNGGSTTMQMLYQMFRAQTGQPFPLHSAVYDSSPGLFTFHSLYNVLMVNFPRGLLRLIATPFVAAFIACLWILHNPLRMISDEDLFTKNWRIHNDPDVVKQTNRTYIYSKTDAMVGWRHVQRHAEQAAAKGLPVRREIFERSPHVSHMRTDEPRYWIIVMETWDSAVLPAWFRVSAFNA